MSFMAFRVSGCFSSFVAPNTDIELTDTNKILGD